VQLSILRHIFTILCPLTLLYSCGGVQKVAVSTTSDLLYKASFEIQNENNYETFKDSVLPSLKLAEGLLSLSPKDQNLLATLTKGHVGFAFGVVETEILELKLGREKNKEELISAKEQQARSHYSKAIDYGLRYFKEKDISYTDLQKALRDEAGIPGLLKKKGLNERDQETALYLGQAIGGLVNLSRDQMVLVSQLPLAKGLFDYVCEVNPMINHGTCDIFYGTYEAGRPAMLGGNPEKGREIFVNFSEKFPQNELGIVMFMEYVLIPKEESKNFYKQLDELLEQREEFNKNMIWSPIAKESSPHYNLELFRTIAFKRVEIFEKNRKTIFR
jgi:hypothetical protein